MVAYYLDEAVFELPPLGFVDRTLHRLESPLSEGDSMTVEVRRVPMESGKSVRERVDADLAAQKSETNGFHVLDDAETSVDGAEAILVRARLRAKDAVYYQQKAHVAYGEVWITVAVTGPYRERAACDEAFARMLTSLEWRSE